MFQSIGPTQALSRAADAVQTKEIRTNTYKNVDIFQLGRFCSSRVNYLKQNVYGKIYPDMLDLSVSNRIIRKRAKKLEIM